MWLREPGDNRGPAPGLALRRTGFAWDEYRGKKPLVLGLFLTRRTAEGIFGLPACCPPYLFTINEGPALWLIQIWVLIPMLMLVYSVTSGKIFWFLALGFPICKVGKGTVC